MDDKIKELVGKLIATYPERFRQTTFSDIASRIATDSKGNVYLLKSVVRNGQEVKMPSVKINANGYLTDYEQYSGNRPVLKPNADKKYVIDEFQERALDLMGGKSVIPAKAVNGRKVYDAVTNPNPNANDINTLRTAVPTLIEGDNPNMFLAARIQDNSLDSQKSKQVQQSRNTTPQVKQQVQTQVQQSTQQAKAIQNPTVPNPMAQSPKQTQTLPPPARPNVTNADQKAFKDMMINDMIRNGMNPKDAEDLFNNHVVKGMQIDSKTGEIYGGDGGKGYRRQLEEFIRNNKSTARLPLTEIEDETQSITTRQDYDTAREELQDELNKIEERIKDPRVKQDAITQANRRFNEKITNYNSGVSNVPLEPSGRVVQDAPDAPIVQQDNKFVPIENIVDDSEDAYLGPPNININSNNQPVTTHVNPDTGQQVVTKIRPEDVIGPESSSEDDYVELDPLGRPITKVGKTNVEVPLPDMPGNLPAPGVMDNWKLNTPGNTTPNSPNTPVPYVHDPTAGMDDDQKEYFLKTGNNIVGRYYKQLDPEIDYDPNQTQSSSQTQPQGQPTQGSLPPPSGDRLYTHGKTPRLIQEGPMDNNNDDYRYGVLPNLNFGRNRQQDNQGTQGNQSVTRQSDPNRPPNAIAYGVKRGLGALNKGANRLVMTDEDFERYYGEERRREREPKAPKVSPYEGMSSAEIVEANRGRGQRRAIREAVDNEMQQMRGETDEAFKKRREKAEKWRQNRMNKNLNRSNDSKIYEENDLHGRDMNRSKGTYRYDNSVNQHQADISATRAENKEELLMLNRDNDVRIINNQGRYQRDAEGRIIDARGKRIKRDTKKGTRNHEMEAARQENARKMRWLHAESPRYTTSQDQIDNSGGLIQNEYKVSREREFKMGGYPILQSGDYIGTGIGTYSDTKDSFGIKSPGLAASENFMSQYTNKSGIPSTATGDNSVLGVFNAPKTTGSDVNNTFNTPVTKTAGSSSNYDPTKLQNYHHKMQYYANTIPFAHNSNKYLFNKPLVERSRYNKQDEAMLSGMRNNLVRANMENVNAQSSATMDMVRQNSRNTGTMMANLQAANTNTANTRNQISHQANTANQQQRSAYLGALHNVGAYRKAEDDQVAARNLQHRVTHDKFGKDAREAAEAMMINKGKILGEEFQDEVSMRNYLNSIAKDYQYKRDANGMPYVEFTRHGSSVPERMYGRKPQMPAEQTKTFNTYHMLEDVSLPIESKIGYLTNMKIVDPQQYEMVKRGTIHNPNLEALIKQVEAASAKPAKPATKLEGGYTNKPIKRNYLF